MLRLDRLTAEKRGELREAACQIAATVDSGEAMAYLLLCLRDAAWAHYVAEKIDSPTSYSRAYVVALEAYDRAADALEEFGK